MKSSFVPLISLGLLAWPAARAGADVVVLQNGVKMEGILATDEDGATTLQVSDDGYVMLDTATVVNIRKQTAAENARLKSKWSEQDTQAAAKELGDRKFVERQRAKGLIQYQDEWVTPAEFDRRLALDRLDVDRARASHPRVSQVNVVVEEQPASIVTYYSYYHAPRYYRKLDYATPAAPTRIFQYSSSGNTIRRSEFSRPSSHPGATYFDPRTGLYR